MDSRSTADLKCTRPKVTFCNPRVSFDSKVGLRSSRSTGVGMAEQKSRRWFERFLPGRARIAWLAPRLGIAVGSLVLTCVVLETGARLLLPDHPPVRLRDGIYCSTLPLVNGRPDGREVQITRGEPLSKDRTPNELRIATFGESSMEGAPWGHAASPATILHDVLAACLPDRKITVINMGRTSSFLMDAFYYLQYVKGYEPDFVVFYQGFNDRFDLDAEACFPENHGTLYGVWRFLVRHSRLLQDVRTFGPEKMGMLHSKDGMDRLQRDRCAPSAFGRWTDLVVEEAGLSGAQVIVATPVRSCLDVLDHMSYLSGKRKSLEEALSDLDSDYREKLVCALDSNCDLLALIGRSGKSMPQRVIEVSTRMRIGHWRDTAARYGVPLVDFYSLLEERFGDRPLGPPIIVDPVHLSVDGYALLAQSIAEEVVRQVRGSSQPTCEIPQPGRYARDIGDEDRIRLERGFAHLEAREFLMGTTMLQVSALRDSKGSAATVLGWLRLRLGLPSELGPEKDSELRALSWEALKEGVLPRER